MPCGRTHRAAPFRQSKGAARASGFNHAVLDSDDSPGARGEIFIVGDHQHREAVLMEALENIEDPFAVYGIQVAGGFVGQQDLRPVDKGPGDGGALHLSARKRRGHVAGALLEPHHAGQLLDARFVRLLLSEKKGQGDVVGHRQAGYQMELLKNESDFFPAQPREFFFAHAVDACPIEQDLSADRRIETAERTFHTI